MDDVAVEFAPVLLTPRVCRFFSERQRILRYAGGARQAFAKPRNPLLRYVTGDKIWYWADRQRKTLIDKVIVALTIQDLYSETLGSNLH